MFVRGLTIIVATGDEARFEAALTLASASAALGARTRVYCHGATVVRLATETPLIATARDIGVALIACQTGLSDAELSFDALAPGVEAGGMVGLLADLGDDRLVTF